MDHSFGLFGTGWNQVLVRLGQEERFKTDDDDSIFENGHITKEDAVTSRLRETLGKELDPIKSTNHGSFYLRMGAVSMSTIQLWIKEILFYFTLNFEQFSESVL